MFRNPNPMLRVFVLVILLPVVSQAQVVSTRVFDFNALPLGTTFGGVVGTPVGQLIAVQDTIEARATVYISSGTPNFVQGMIQVAGAIGSGKLVALSSIGMSFDFQGTGDVSFVYRDLGGTVNLRVNGGNLLEVPDFMALNNGLVAAGVTAQVTGVQGGGSIVGTVTLTGDVRTLVIAGAELEIDDVKVIGYSDSSNPGGTPHGNCDLLIDHESLPVGQTWLSPTASPGDVIFTEDGMDVVLDRFNDGTQLLFDGAGIEPAIVVGTSHVLRLTNTVAVYDLAAQGASASRIEFTCGDAGLVGNLTVNGSAAFVGDLTLAPLNIAPGVTLQVQSSLTTPARRVILTGDVTLLRVGGAAFMIDDICFTMGQGPVYGGCDNMVTTDGQLAGTVWDSPSFAPGDLVFVEDGIPVSVARYNDGVTLAFGMTTVVPAIPDFGTGNVLHSVGTTVGFDLSGLGDVVQVSIDYLDAGTVENLQVNGGLLQIGNLAATPALVAPGVTAIVVENMGPSGPVGRVVLNGPVRFLRLGGADLFMDRLCVRVNGPTSSPVADLPVPRMMARAYPNPFNPSTTLQFSLAAGADVTLAVYNVQGKLVRELIAGTTMSSGAHSVSWLGRDESGRAVGSGMYFARLRVGDRMETQKLVLIK